MRGIVILFGLVVIGAICLGVTGAASGFASRGGEITLLSNDKTVEQGGCEYNCTGIIGNRNTVQQYSDSYNRDSSSYDLFCKGIIGVFIFLGVIFLLLKMAAGSSYEYY